MCAIIRRQEIKLARIPYIGAIIDICINLLRSYTKLCDKNLNMHNLLHNSHIQSRHSVQICHPTVTNQVTYVALLCKTTVYY